MFYFFKMIFNKNTIIIVRKIDPNKRYDWCGKYPKWINLNAITWPTKAENIRFFDDNRNAKYSI